MENHQNGRAIIENGLDELKITVPQKCHCFVVGFLGFWLCFWAIGWIMSVKSLFENGFSAGNSFLGLWFCAWTLGGFAVISFFFWMLFGREIITIDRREWRVEKKAFIVFHSKTYDSSRIERLRVQEKAWTTKRGGQIQTWPIQFFYGLRTFDFASGLDEPENLHILQLLREGRWLKPEQFEISTKN